MNSKYSHCLNSNNQPGIWKSVEMNLSFLWGNASSKAGSAGCMTQSYLDESACIARFIAAIVFVLLTAFTDVPLVYLAPVFALVVGAFVTEISSAASDPSEEPEPVYPDESDPTTHLIAVSALILLSTWVMGVPLVYLGPAVALVFGAFIRGTSEATLSPDPDDDDEPADNVRPSVRFSGVDLVYRHDVSIIMGPNLTDRNEKKSTGYQVVLGRNSEVVTQATDYRDKGRVSHSRKTPDMRRYEAMKMINSGMFYEDEIRRYHADAAVENDYNIKLNRLNATEAYLSALAREIGGNEIGRNEVALRYRHLSLEWIDDGYEWFVAINPEAAVMSFDSMNELWNEVYLNLQ